MVKSCAFYRWTLILGVTLLVGCSSSRPMPHRNKDFSPVLPTTMLEEPVPDGSIYTKGVRDGLFGDSKAYRVGDLITIVLQEDMSSIKNVSNNLNRKSTNSLLSGLQRAALAGGSAFGWPWMIASDLNNTPGEAETEQELKNESSGSTGHANTLFGQISASVVRVLSNKNLVVRGEKLITLNQGDEYIQISGIIRPEDVLPDNTVLSFRVANAQITYSGSGEVHDATRAGWGTSLLYKIWPF
jgi:flagellar L-ring protein FlgH